MEGRQMFIEARLIFSRSTSWQKKINDYKSVKGACNLLGLTLCLPCLCRLLTEQHIVQTAS